MDPMSVRIWGKPSTSDTMYPSKTDSSDLFFFFFLGHCLEHGPNVVKLEARISLHNTTLRG